MDITVYTNSSDKRCLTKSKTEIGTYTGLIIKDSIDILTPSFILQNIDNGIISEIMGFANYMYIPTLARYYYITDKQLLTGTRVSITGLIDPLQTYAEQIKACRGTAVRNENIDFSYIVDEQVPVESYLTVRFIAEAKLFDNKTQGTNFILNVAGGGSNGT